jgi:hypothetical protein
MIAKQTYLFESSEYSIERFTSIQLSGISGAQFSNCGRYRYALWRVWDAKSVADMVMFIGLNPSTADATRNDATLRRCIAFAKRLGFGGLFMLNAYAWRSTSPKALGCVEDPIGPENDRWLWHYSSLVSHRIAAWGSHCSRDRQAALCELLDVPMFCFGTTGNGSPKHPLYLKSSMATERFQPPTRKGIRYASRRTEGRSPRSPR